MENDYLSLSNLKEIAEIDSHIKTAKVTDKQISVA